MHGGGLDKRRRGSGPAFACGRDQAEAEPYRFAGPRDVRPATRSRAPGTMSAQGAGEPASECTRRCMSERAEVATQGWPVHGVRAWRRGRDSNPRCSRTPLFESGTINHSDTSPPGGYQRGGRAPAASKVSAECSWPDTNATRWLVGGAAHGLLSAECLGPCTESTTRVHWKARKRGCSIQFASDPVELVAGHDHLDGRFGSGPTARRGRGREATGQRRRRAPRPRRGGCR